MYIFMVFLTFYWINIGYKFWKTNKKFLINIMIILNIFVGERCLDPPPHQVTTGLNKPLEDIFTVLKFIFGS